MNPHSPIVKICGITNPEDAELAADLGADAIGFNFYRNSARYIEPADALAIRETLPPTVKIVGVFVNESVENILAVAKQIGLDAIQLHGDEDTEYISKLRTQTAAELIKAFRVGPSFDPGQVLMPGLDAVLLDSFSVNEYGGTGKVFDWNTAAEVRKLVPKLYLAGGLTSRNIHEAITKINPYAVDACSGLERAKGLKDHAEMKRFMAEVARTRLTSDQGNKTHG